MQALKEDQEFSEIYQDIFLTENDLWQLCEKYNFQI